MPRTINPVRKARLKQELLDPRNSVKDALIKSGYEQTTARASTNNKCVKICQAEIASEMNSAGLVESFKNLIRKKIELEHQVLDIARRGKEKKYKLAALKASKDNIADLHKSLRLEQGESTANVRIDEAERQARIDRLRGLYAIPQPVVISPTENKSSSECS